MIFAALLIIAIISPADQLILVIEVSRHGARAPARNLDFIVDPNWQKPPQLIG